VLSLADEVIVLDDGVVVSHGTPEQVRHDPAVIAAYLGDTATTTEQPEKVTARKEAP
jgi:ABC-type uncharacterized transport system ATPase subunit